MWPPHARVVHWNVKKISISKITTQQRLITMRSLLFLPVNRSIMLLRWQPATAMADSSNQGKATAKKATMREMHEGRYALRLASTATPANSSHADKVAPYDDNKRRNALHTSLKGRCLLSLMLAPGAHSCNFFKSALKSEPLEMNQIVLGGCL